MSSLGKYENSPVTLFLRIESFLLFLSFRRVRLACCHLPAVRSEISIDRSNSITGEKKISDQFPRSCSIFAELFFGMHLPTMRSIRTSTSNTSIIIILCQTEREKSIGDYCPLIGILFFSRCEDKLSISETSSELLLLLLMMHSIPL